jgi:hypothetical protein
MNLLKIFCVLFLFLGFAYGIEIKINSQFKLYSSDDLTFQTKAGTFSDMGKISEYQGTLHLQSESNLDLANADFYLFPKEKKISLNEEMCKSYAEKIFGDMSKRSHPIKLTTLFNKTTSGNSCQVNFKDSVAKKPNRFSIIGFVHGQLVAMVWSLSRSPDVDSKQKMQKFFNALK